jgi:hypothetical protein
MTSQTFKKKWENYWYYYKWHTFGAIFILVVMAVTITQCATTVKPDATIMFISKTTPISSDVTASIESDLAKYITDFNKDGKKKVELMNLDFSVTDPTMIQATQAKFMGELQTADSFLFLVDDAAYTAYSQEGIFAKMKDVLPDVPSTDGYRIPVSSLDIFKNSTYKDILKNYSFVMRLYKGSSVDKSSNDAAYQNSVNILKRIIANSKTSS